MSSFRISEALVLSLMVAGGALGLGACGGGSAMNGSGGASGSGGATASGGKAGSGGATGSGGTSGSGGAATTGSGGAASGGSASGGSGGSASGGQAATGGMTGSGGGSASGGQPGSGGAGGGTGPGSGGATSSGGAGGGAGAPGGCLICDDFESSSSLDAAKWVVDATRGGKAEIVTSGAHGSGKAVKVSAGYIKIDAKPELFANVPLHFFIRVSMKFDMAQPSMHVTYLMLADKTNMGQLRIGAQNGGMIWNYDKTDSILPDFNAAAMSLKPPANEWHCFEFEIDGTAPAMHAWMDGTESPQMLYDSTPTTGIDDRWMRDMPGWKPNITSFGFGAGDPVGTLTTWFDDIAISSARLGCP